MKKIISLFISFFCGVSALVSQQSSTGFETLDYLYSISGKSTLAGQHGRDYWSPIQQIAGDYPALWGEDFLFYPSDGTTSMDDWRKLIVHDAKQHWLQGALISLMFHACPPTTSSQTCDWWSSNEGTCSTCIHNTLTDAQWTQLITDGTTLNNTWKARLDEIYPYLKELEDAGVEVLFRMFHEMNQGFFWWAGHPGPNGTAKLYQITHDYLVKTKGLTNLIWVWNLQDFSSLSTDLNDYDPGSDYWDVLALDIYGSDGNRYTSTKYNLIKNKAAGKPIAIGECDVLPTSSILYSQPYWTYFMAWADLTQSSNSNATIHTLYNAANVLTLSRTGRAPVVKGDQDPSIICNFDDVFPYVSADYGVSLDIVDAPADSPASGKMGALWVPKNNSDAGFLVVYLNEPIDPRNYTGISFLAQTSQVNNVPFVLKLEQTTDNTSSAQIQDWSTYPKYTGNGEWQEVHIPFNVLLGSSQSDQLGYKLNHNANFPVAGYNRIVIVPAPYQNLPEFTLNIDDIKLIASNGAGIPLTINTDPILITAVDGTISAKAANGNPVSLKVYSIPGQEIANGVNQVQLGMKGAYIVKATAGNISKVSKIIVQ